MKNFSEPYSKPVHSFVRKYGIILSVSAAALILGATYAGTRGDKPAPLATQDPLPLSTPAAYATAEPMFFGKATPSPTSAPETAAPAPSSEPTPAAEAPGLQILEPTVGTIVRQFAGDRLIFSQTLAQWSTHSGMDVRTDPGAAIVAARDGRVESVSQDPMLGNTVVLLHDGDVRTVYASLEDVLVSTGDTVSMGQTIASAGDTAISESGEGYHLHFEMYVGDTPIDPRPHLFFRQP